MLYLDASALVKLVVEERESVALERELAAHPVRVTSVLSAVEVRRAVRRQEYGSPYLQRATDVVAGVTLLGLDEQVVRGAVEVEPFSLRTLDALHLASALSLGPSLDALATYDVRLGAAAIEAGLEVIAPT